MSRCPEKPSLWRRLAHLLCSHWAWEGATYYSEDDHGRDAKQVTVRRCMSCGLMTWEVHR